jgi:hypothetical protein
MSEFAKKAAAYRKQAGTFNSASGANLFQDSNFLGQQSQNSFLGQGAERMQYANGAAPQGAAFSKLADSNQIYTAVLENTNSSGDPVTCTLFGANIYGITNDQIGGVNGTGGRSVTISESSHAQVRSQSLYSPFWINGFRFRVTTTPQLSINGTLQVADSAGTIVSNQFRPLTYFTATQQQNLQVDATTLKYQVDGSTSFLLPVIAAEQVTMIMKIGARFAPENVVDNASPLEVGSQNPLSTGTPTVIVQR